MEPGRCFHCNEAVPAGLSLQVMIFGASRSMCCPGCQAVATAIIDYGLEQYYRYRTSPPARPEAIVPDILDQIRVYDEREFQAGFVAAGTGSRQSVQLILEGVVCPACTWLIESRLAQLAGVLDIAVNYATGRARIDWDDSRLLLSRILEHILALGYRAYPYNPGNRQALMEDERKQLLRRLGLAGVLGMQVMMLSVAIYIGDWSGMEFDFRQFFYWICLLLTAPVVIYSARPFFRRAWRDLRLLRTGMDVPVTLGISMAFVGSVFATVTGRGHVYYDSVVMFVFLLLTARYFEFTARRRAGRYYDELERIIPATATRLVLENGVETQQQVPVAQLQAGDRILVRPGETICADGVVVAGTSTVDEAVITGESFPVIKRPDAVVIGGSTNIESPLQCKIERTGQETFLSRIISMAQAGQAEKPGITLLTNRIAAWFVFSVILLAAAVAVYWWHTNKELWLPATIALLVITCPCALSLATPVAITSASATLVKHGIAMARNGALETLSRANCFVFDKTGTLTRGELQLREVISLSGLDRQQCLVLAAALESGSEHPLARAVLAQVQDYPALQATGIVNVPGAGISGHIESRQYYLGNTTFIRQHTGLEVPALNTDTGPVTTTGYIVLADDRTLHGIITFADQIRTGAGELIRHLQARQCSTLLLSGDSAAATAQVADTLGISNYHYRLQAHDKLAMVRALIAQGNIVAVIGDGINDAPVLAAAHVSIAMGAGVDLARINADMVLINNHLETLDFAVTHAQNTMTIIRQNLSWAIAYNLLALPVAAAGLVAPWMAAVGMSLSSLLVVGNSLRLGR